MKKLLTRKILTAKISMFHNNFELFNLIVFYKEKILLFLENMLCTIWPRMVEPLAKNVPHWGREASNHAPAILTRIGALKNQGDLKNFRILHLFINFYSCPALIPYLLISRKIWQKFGNIVPSKRKLTDLEMLS